MPLLPLLKSNAAEREKLKKRSVTYLFIKGACNKVNVVVKTFADAIEQEKKKSFYSLLYTIETMEDEEIITQEKIY
jgi:Fe-S cluster biogenesis protein NfuA